MRPYQPSLWTVLEASTIHDEDSIDSQSVILNVVDLDESSDSPPKALGAVGFRIRRCFQNLHRLVCNTYPERDRKNTDGGASCAVSKMADCTKGHRRKRGINGQRIGVFIVE